MRQGGLGGSEGLLDRRSFFLMVLLLAVFWLVVAARALKRVVIQGDTQNACRILRSVFFAVESPKKCSM